MTTNEPGKRRDWGPTEAELEQGYARRNRLAQIDAEIATVRRLLALVPDDMGIDRASLQGRIDRLIEAKEAGRG